MAALDEHAPSEKAELIRSVLPAFAAALGAEADDYPWRARPWPAHWVAFDPDDRNFTGSGWYEALQGWRRRWMPPWFVQLAANGCASWAWEPNTSGTWILPPGDPAEDWPGQVQSRMGETTLNETAAVPLDVALIPLTSFTFHYDGPTEINSMIAEFERQAGDHIERMRAFAEGLDDPAPNEARYIDRDLIALARRVGGKSWPAAMDGLAYPSEARCKERVRALAAELGIDLNEIQTTRR